MQLEGAEAAPLARRGASRRCSTATGCSRSRSRSPSACWCGSGARSKTFSRPPRRRVRAAVHRPDQGECARVRAHARALQVIATQPSDRFPKDVVMSQQPAAGSRVREGRQVSLVVSTGVRSSRCPTCVSSRCATRASTSTTQAAARQDDVRREQRRAAQSRRRPGSAAALQRAARLEGRADAQQRAAGRRQGAQLRRHVDRRGARRGAARAHPPRPNRVDAVRPVGPARGDDRAAEARIPARRSIRSKKCRCRSAPARPSTAI